MGFTFDTRATDGRVPDSESPSAYVRALEQQVASLEFAGKKDRADEVRKALEEAKKAVPAEVAGQETAALEGPPEKAVAPQPARKRRA